jgi:hypothetical protein
MVHIIRTFSNQKLGLVLTLFISISFLILGCERPDMSCGNRNEIKFMNETYKNNIPYGDTNGTINFLDGNNVDVVYTLTGVQNGFNCYNYRDANPGCFENSNCDEYFIYHFQNKNNPLDSFQITNSVKYVLDPYPGYGSPDIQINILSNNFKFTHNNIYSYKSRNFNNKIYNNVWCSVGINKKDSLFYNTEFGIITVKIFKTKFLYLK